MEDSPVKAIKTKKDSSMVKAMELVRREPNSVLVSAGNTGALLAGGLLIVGRIKGIDRPALHPYFLIERMVLLWIWELILNANQKIWNNLQLWVLFIWKA